MDSSNIFTILDVLFNLHSIINNGLILGGQNSSKRERPYSFCLLIPETKGIKILQRLTSMNHVVNNTCTVLGRNIKTRYFGLILILRFKRSNILSDSIECNHLSRNTSSLLYSKSCEIEDWRSVI